MKFRVYKDRAGEYRWRLLAANGQVIATPGEGYTTKAACLANIESVKRCGDAPVEEEED